MADLAWVDAPRIFWAWPTTLSGLVKPWLKAKEEEIEKQKSMTKQKTNLLTKQDCIRIHHGRKKNSLSSKWTHRELNPELTHAKGAVYRLPTGPSLNYKFLIPNF